MSNKRPVNLNLMTIKFPVTAISSILHRISGFVLFLLIPFLLWGFSLSMTQDGFARLQVGWVIHLFVWFLASGLIYHIIAGIRHLLMDVGYFEEKESGRLSSWVAIVLSAVLIVVAGGWLL
jgi:succinate dehydrogenase / fumarate reductase cytochrome b subunit